MLLTTTDTLSRPYTEVAMVQTSVRAAVLANPEGAIAQGYMALDRQAAAMGASAVIGVRVTTLTPGLYLLTGTAVRLS